MSTLVGNKLFNIWVTRAHRQLSEYQQPKSVERDTQGNNISFTVNPASGLFLYYRF